VTYSTPVGGSCYGNKSGTNMNLSAIVFVREDIRWGGVRRAEFSFCNLTREFSPGHSAAHQHSASNGKIWRACQRALAPIRTHRLLRCIRCKGGFYPPLRCLLLLVLAGACGGSSGSTGFTADAGVAFAAGATLARLRFLCVIAFTSCPGCVML